MEIEVEVAARAGAVFLDLGADMRHGGVVLRAARAAALVGVQPEADEAAVLVDGRREFGEARVEGAPAMGVIGHGRRVTLPPRFRHLILAP